MSLIGRWLALALGLCLPAAPAPGAVEQVSIRVDGLSCPFCAFNIEKRVKTLEGVPGGARIVTSLESGVATFPWRPGVAFDPAAVRRAIREAGFTPRQIRLKATGTVRVAAAVNAKGLGLIDEATGHGLSMRPAERADRRESWDALRALAGADRARGIRVEGEVLSEPSDRDEVSWHLVLHRWSPLKFGAEVVIGVDALSCEGCSLRVMQALRPLEGVIHVEADNETDRVRVWTRAVSPDVAALRESIASLGFKAGHLHTRVPEP